MPVSGYVSVTLRYEDMREIDQKRQEGETNVAVVRRALNNLESK